MSHQLILSTNDTSFNSKLTNENTKSNYNNFRHYSSLIKKNVPKNQCYINTSSSIQNNPNRVRYINTESIFSNNNVCTCINCTNTLNSVNSNILNLPNTPHKKLPVNYKMYYMNKNRLFSANNFGKKMKKIIYNGKNNNKEKEIYLNNYINSSSDEINNKRLQSSKGFLRKIDYELNNLLQNQNNRKCLTIHKHDNNDKNFIYNFHDNNYKYDYVLSINDKNNIRKGLNYDIKYKNKNNKKNGIINNNNKNSEKKQNFFLSMINNITRKVEFLNTKNDTLSDENIMNLLNNEENFLCKKLDNFLKDNYSIKKFSKSIFDEKNGNKYLLPLFNNKMKTKDIKNENRNNRAEINKNREHFNKLNILNDLKDLNNINTSKDYNRKIVKVFSKKRINDKDNKKLKVWFFPSNMDDLIPKIEKRKIINLSSDTKRNNNKIKYYKKENEFFIINSKHNYEKDILSMNTNRENNYDELVLEHKKITNYDSMKNIFPKTKDKKNKNTKIIEENKKSNFRTISLNKPKYIDFINKKPKKYYSERKVNFIKQKNYNDEENDISEININRISKMRNNFNDIKKKFVVSNKNRNKSNKENKKNKKVKSKDKEKEKEKENEIENENENEKEEEDENNKSDISEATKEKINLLKEAKKKSMKNYNLYLKKYLEKMKDNEINSIEDIEKNIYLKKLILEETNENISDISSSIDIKKEEEKLKKLKNVTFSNNVILKKNIEIEEKKLIDKIKRKRSKTMKLLFSYIKHHLKDEIKEGINEEKIKKLLSEQEFRETVDLLKVQIDKTKEFSNKDPSKIIAPITDDEVIIILYSEIIKEEKMLSQNYNSSKKLKSSYIPQIHLKNQKQKSGIQDKDEKDLEEEEEKENIEYIRIKQEREKEKEKLKYMVNEMTLSNELRFHIQETNNKELRERFQSILSQIESYQNLNMADYVEAIKNNYLLLKEEMNKIISDKETEERINGFITNLDIERNVLESKWYYLSSKLNIIDNKFHSYIEGFDNPKTNED